MPYMICYVLYQVAMKKWASTLNLVGTAAGKSLDA